MPHASAVELLVLHGVRLAGMAEAAGVARRFALDRHDVEELLLDLQAAGRVRFTEFADVRGWSLTDAGRTENERQLAAELDEADARDAVTAAHATFVGLNARFLETITRWQIRPAPWDAMAPNDHTDWRWDERVLDTLAGLSRRLGPVEAQLTSALPRFEGYTGRFAAALDRARSGQPSWVDAPRVDSCHTVWFQLHEDLLATLGLERGAGG